jgi:hypothetical protein
VLGRLLARGGFRGRGRGDSVTRYAPKKIGPQRWRRRGPEDCTR